MPKKRKNNNIQTIIGIIFTIVLVIAGYFSFDNEKNINEVNTNTEQVKSISSFDISSIPDYTNEPYVIINNNIPEFTENDYTLNPFENYSELDSLGRCGVAFANICKEIMPKKRRN